MDWFTADLHLSHKNIIQYNNRPYGSIAEMNEAIHKMIKKPKPGDNVYILGDVSFNTGEFRRFMENIDPAINMYLVKGNHDNEPIYNHPRWKWVKEFVTVKLNEDQVTLCHYPLGAWPGTFHLHGHTHGGYWRTSPGMYDVSIDAKGKAQLWQWPELRKILMRDMQTVKMTKDYNSYTKNYSGWMPTNR